MHKHKLNIENVFYQFKAENEFIQLVILLKFEVPRCVHNPPSSVQSGFHCIYFFWYRRCKMEEIIKIHELIHVPTVFGNHVTQCTLFAHWFRYFCLKNSSQFAWMPNGTGHIIIWNTIQSSIESLWIPFVFRLYQFRPSAQCSLFT